MGTLSSHHGQQTTADERRIRKMWMAETVYVSTSSLLALGACALWVNKRFTDAFTSNKESACFYWTPPGECFAHHPIVPSFTMLSPILIALASVLQRSSNECIVLECKAYVGLLNENLKWPNRSNRPNRSGTAIMYDETACMTHEHLFFAISRLTTVVESHIWNQSKSKRQALQVMFSICQPWPYLPWTSFKSVFFLKRTIWLRPSDA